MVGMKLEKETRKLVKTDKRKPQAIAKASGIDMRWIYRFQNDQSADYGIRRVQKLHDYLSK
jgi:hypothetical protein